LDTPSYRLYEDNLSSRTVIKRMIFTCN